WLTVLVVQTGVGVAATEKALAWLLSQPRVGDVPYRPRLVLSAGYAGALREDEQIGDIILATDVMDTAGTIRSTTWPGELPAGEWRPPIRRGRLLTVAQLVGDPAAKRELGAKHDAVAVDMESAVVAAMCAKRGVPFGCLRANSDRQDMALS